MENPYWHDQYKPHLVKRDGIRRLCFQIDSLVTASTTRQGSGTASDSEDEKDERANTLLDDLFYRMAESELSKRLLHLALLVRTFDDTMSRGDDPTPYEKHRTHVDSHQGPFGHVFEGSPNVTETIRDCSNKIIHAEDVRPTYETEDDSHDPEARWGMTGVIELKGVLRGEKWSIDIFLPAYLEGILELVQFGEELAAATSNA